MDAARGWLNTTAISRGCRGFAFGGRSEVPMTSPVSGLTRVATLFSILALEARIDGLTFKREDTKNTFVNTAKRFLPNESFQRFNPKSEFAKC